jgi:hypothetical protein
MRSAIFAGCFVLLSACVTTSKIVPAGKDTYMISAANDTCGNCTPPEIRATEQASEYCTKMGKTMVMKDSQEHTFDIGFGHRITMTFSCVAS